MGRTTSGLAELTSISLLKPSPSRRKVRVQPFGSGGRARASKETATTSPGFETTNRSSVSASSSRTSPRRGEPARHGFQGQKGGTNAEAEAPGPPAAGGSPAREPP